MSPMSARPAMHPLPAPASVWRDTPQRFGFISRGLHWAMALLLAWQFAGMVAKVTLGKDAALTSVLAAAHAHVGLLLLVLAAARCLWGWANKGRRPRHGAGVIGVAAWLGHLALYALMLVVPFLAMLRMLGNNRPFNWFGVIPLNDGLGEKVEWMVAPASAVHGVLGWALLALIVGHMLMVLMHRYFWKDEVAQRMLGRMQP
jgi:cytochrome b561